MQFCISLVSAINVLFLKNNSRLIVIVSIERATAVIWPLKARNFWTSSMLFFLVVAIWVSAIFLSLHYHITHEVITLTKPVKIKNHTTGQEKIETRPVIQHQIKEGMEKYWNIAILSEMIALVFVPVLLVLGSNTLMIIALRRQNREHDVHIKRQRRATLIVVIIASTFTISQMPSAVIHLISLIYPKIKNEEKFRIAAVLTNSLVVMGKTANFFLFCTWSSYFRKNLNRVISMKMPCLYHFCEKGMTRFRSNSSLGDSNNHRMSKIRLQRFKSAPANTEYHFCIDNLKPNNSFPLNAKNSFRTTEKILEETQIEETSTFIVNNNKEHILPLVTDL